MILAKAPLRVSLFGGGSDLPSHSNEYGGACFSMAINKYMHVALNTTEHDYVKVMYSKVEQVKNFEELEHDIVRESLKTYSYLNNGIEIASFADIPTQGTGLGSSSTFAVALLRAMDEVHRLHFYPNSENYYTSEVNAEQACYIELEKCKSPIGKQDQYAAAFGGLNMFEFKTTGYVKVRKQHIDQSFAANFILVYTGMKRDTNKILSYQNENPNHHVLNKMADMAVDAKTFYVKDQYEEIGALLNDAWHYKKEVSPLISNEYVDALYKRGMELGALGGKLLGAGGGGYMLFYVDNNIQYEFREQIGLPTMKFEISPTGSEIVYAN